MYRPTTNLLQKRWDTKAVMETATIDVLSDYSGNYDGKKRTVPNAVFVKFDLKGKRSGVMFMLKKISGAGVTGRDVLLGNEQDQDTREQLCYGNDVAQAIGTEQYGIDANEKSPYKLLEAVQPQLTDWMKEIRGQYMRQALLQKFSINLTVAPHSLTQVWNENILVKNVALATGAANTANVQPDYQGAASAAEYLEMIGDAITSAGSTAACNWDVRFLNRIIYWATIVKKIEPLDNGKYLVLVPSRQAALLKDPQSTTSIPGLFINSNVMEFANVGRDQYLGDFGPLMLFEDPRSPIVKRGGSNGTWTLTAYYKGAGDDDDRSGVTGDVYDVGFLCGKMAGIEGTYEETHFEDELQNYGKIKGIGICAGFGFQRSVWLNDNSSETRSKTINQSSMALLAYASSLTA
jgi:hypothetical protein